MFGLGTTACIDAAKRRESFVTAKKNRVTHSSKNINKGRTGIIKLLIIKLLILRCSLFA